jgi:hypothetical protein
MASGFYATVPVFDRFDKVADPSVYRPLPESWWIGFTDVVHSTRAVAEGRFKAVNMAGAASIAAISNALGRRSFPYAFGGDGAVLAVPPVDAGIVRQALAATATWTKAELDLDLRVALVPIEDIRAAGHDVTVARFAPSAHVDYAMFSGGGIGWVERQVKSGGAYRIEPSPNERPDLSGLSCRWGETPATRGLIVSILVLPGGQGIDAAFRRLIGEVLDMVADPARAGHPLPDTGPKLSWPPKGLDFEVGATIKEGQSRPLQKAKLMVIAGLSYLILKLNLRVGSFRSRTYKRELVENTDFRKFDDGLRLTLDCEPALADEVEARLAEARRQGLARYGIHRQKSALVTCIVPSPTEADHVHFVDGASGGYTAAAKALKEAE